MASKPAAEIIQSIGGAGNVVGLTHCATRLRFQLKDASGIDQSAVEAIPAVLGAVPQTGDRYQVVIGGAVETVYNEIMALPEMKRISSGGSSEGDSVADMKAAGKAKGPRGKFAALDTFFEVLSDSFRPILGALLGASLFITFMALMATLGVIPAWNAPGVTLDPSWQFVNLMWQGVFVFLPLMVAYNASKRMGADPWVGFGIMAVVMLPGFTALGKTDGAESVFGGHASVVQIFGLPLTVFDYSSQVFPPLLMAGVLAALTVLLKKIIPSSVQLIFVPFISMLIMIPLTAFLIGPIGVYGGAGLGNFLKSINDFSPFIFAVVIPLAYPFMVPLGLHWPLNAIMLLNIQSLGFDFIQGPMGAWNFACFGATAGVLFLAIREKDRLMKQTATGALAAGLLGGISEPSLYGIHLRFKRIYPRMLIGCLVGGVIIGLGGGVKTSAFVFTSLLTIPAFDNIPLYTIAIAAAFFTAMILVILSGYQTPEQKAEVAAQVAADEAETSKKSAHVASVAAPVAAGTAGAGVATATATSTGTATAVATLLATIGSPVAGIVVPLAEVPDPVFSKGIVGPGVGIDPTEDTVYAPAAGKVLVAQPTGHAFGLLLDSGVELLIHVGIDTVNLAGKGFDVKVAAGDRVEAGTPLVVFDRTIIEDAGYSLVTPVLVTNARKFGPVEQAASGHVQVGSPLLTVAAK
ncbi:MULTISPECIES: glucose PTS transporter subunit IIA [unclassified Cryobacterium]|uniref:glucose PTS transporter subunit IIA n=1 Tax=unclassified Cryobacterium TaxID=2649013 RepID=UPI0010691853|nr:MULTISPECIES: glucose PTS transporter subunit IIA [unclassified Cryobacterium]TFB93806.1 PTS beta-glucoside transporter subunit EIIBCA [Cryobacterium sp. MDB2-A-1]TFC08983.1 PTS beta-glucoside transporter subunit EIIBCA [Cryobacterium sp. MDB2-33-2]TFC14763.1 PTS beta-glucoside transporter subunit EIIBCA [Cryobacterium sp. MDB2-A-2]TFC19061.1 PTS beta-glucoside transporter subunit EIIBCA [Cryobacterium sp. MDB2-10]